MKHPGTRIIAIVVRVGLSALLTMASPIASAAAQGGIASAAEFSAAAPADRLLFLGALSSHKQTIPPEELRGVLSLALEDGDREMRRGALITLASRAGGVRLSDRGELRVRWFAERPILVTFKPAILNRLVDPDAGVRSAAVRALTSLDFDLANLQRELGTETLQRLEEIYLADPAPEVRSDVVRALSTVCMSSVHQDNVLLAALNETRAGLLQDAIAGVAKCRLASGLPRVSSLLTHEHVAVRLAAGQALATFAQLSAPYRQQVEAALGIETDAVVRRTLQGTMRVIDRQNAP